jgi:transcriptional regulator with XRE-family HTH domain
MMETSIKKKIQLKIGITLQKIIQMKKAGSDEDHKIIKSLRNLAATSGIEYALIQKISNSSKNPALTTLVGIADAFNMKMAEFFEVFDRITENEIIEETKKLEDKKKSAREK